MSDLLFGIEMLLIFGGVLAFAVWELIKLNRDEKREKQRDVEADE
ncbi:MAG: hypothetical protein RIA71_03485 [Oceanicaulis sp.]